MKLIDLLVQELPKRGGWPEGALTCAYGEAGRRIGLHFGTGVLGVSRHHKPSILEAHGADSVCTWYNKEIEVNQAPEDSAVITRDQYEAALAASKQVEWDGEGLPPVGCEFEYGTHRSVAKCIAVSHHHVFASKGDPEDENSDYEEFLIDIGHSSFYPLSTEAERKRDGFIDLLMTEWAFLGQDGEQAGELYDAIAAGKIPGIKLAD